MKEVFIVIDQTAAKENIVEDIVWGVFSTMEEAEESKKSAEAEAKNTWKLPKDRSVYVIVRSWLE